jgi:hypothetical protein
MGVAVREVEDRLRKCPTCLGDLPEEGLGLRDFKWIESALPGRAGASDIDFVLEQSKTGRVLIIEHKPDMPGQLPMGQRIMLKRFVRVEGFDVWIAWEEDDHMHVKVGAMDRNGQVPFIERMPVEKFRVRVTEWWQAGFDTHSPTPTT